MDLNQEFLTETFFSYCKRPLYKRYQNVYNSECPICKEGKSAGRSRRLFYFPAKKYFYCHNCLQSWRPFDWVKEVTGWSFPEIVNKNKEKENSSSPTTFVKAKPLKVELEIPDLPAGSIDLSDPNQVQFYKDNKYVKIALDYCHQRRLFTAKNSCKKFFISLEDKIHRHRLIIPFYNNNKIVCYQSRALTNNQFPKYLTKFGDKQLFGINNVDSSLPYVFIFEGPIDSMFVKNGLAMASLSPTEQQLQQLKNMVGYEQIWVFDNDKNNKQTFNRITKHIKEGKRTFIWPKEFAKFKDFNEMCCKLNLNEVPANFVVENSLTGNQALLKQMLFNKKD